VNAAAGDQRKAYRQRGPRPPLPQGEGRGFSPKDPRFTVGPFVCGNRLGPGARYNRGRINEFPQRTTWIQTPRVRSGSMRQGPPAAPAKLADDPSPP
jgi:hypothetical protein